MICSILEVGATIKKKTAWNGHFSQGAKRLKSFGAKGRPGLPYLTN